LTVTGALLTPDERRILSWSTDATLRLWDIGWPSGNLLEIACTLLPERDLADISHRYGVVLTDPICPAGKAPAEPDWAKVERASILC
jgi:hypothetical protein